MPLQPDPVPLRLDEQGVIRVGDSALPLERVIDCYNSGARPEGIVECYDTLRLADVHGALAYYLNHHTEVETYLAHRELAAEEERKKIANDYPMSSARLLALAEKYPPPQQWYEEDSKPF